MDTALISEEDAALLRDGILTDCNYSLDYYKRELTLFLEKQLRCFFREVDDVVQQYVEENDCEYLLLMIRRYHLRYQQLYFFADFAFLEEPFRAHLQKELSEKLLQYDRDLITYFDRLAQELDSMSEVSTNIERLIEVQKDFCYE